MIVDVQVNTSGAKGAAGQTQGTLGALNNQLNQVNAAVNQGAQAWGIWGRAFRGAFVGAVAGMAFSQVISGITGIIGGLRDLGVASVRAAADFQDTSNAMKVFTGSASAARDELSQIAAVARATPGLRLEDAEQGAVRLRALGFEAKITQDLLVGLSKQKLMSGADEQMMNRVIVNIQQLAAGSPQAMRDIRQMVLAFPTLSTVITDTFGTIEKFRDEINRDPDSALRKFAAAMKNVEAPAAGLNDAIGKLADAAITAGREFGKPILDPLTDSVKMLTDLLYSNQSTWASWGQTVGDAIRSVNDIAAGSGALWQLLGGNAATGTAAGRGALSGAVSGAGTAALTLLGGPLTAGLSVLDLMGQSGRAMRERQAPNDLARLAQQEGFLRGDNTVDFQNGTFTTAQERRVQQLQQERQSIRQQENARQRNLASLEAGSKEASAILEQRFAREEAMLDRHLRTTAQQELAYVKQLGAVRDRNLKAQQSVEIGYLDAQIKLHEKGSDERIELESEKAVKIAEFNAKLAKNEAETQKAIQEQEKRILDDRREAAIGLKQIQIQSATDRASAARFWAEREIEIYDSGYSDLTRIAAESYQEIARLTVDSYNLQLSNADLTTEQRINLQEKLNAELRTLAEQNAREMAEISDKQLQSMARRMRESLDVSRGLGTAFTQGQRGLLGTLQPGAFFGQDTAIMESVFGASGSALSGNIQGVLEGRVSFWKTIEPLLATIHAGERENLNKEIRLNEDLLDLEKHRLLLFEQTTIANARKRDAELEKQGIDINDPQRQVVQDIIAQRQANINDLNDGKIASAEGLRLKNANRRLELERSILSTTQEQERRNRQAALDLDLINARTRDIANGIHDQSINQANLLDQTKEYQAVVLEMRTQEVALGNDQYVQTVRQIEAMREIIGLRQQELDAILSIDASNRAIDRQMVFNVNQSNAKVLDFLASQKGITEIISDAKINLLSAAYSGLDSVIGRLTKGMGAFGDAIKETLTSLIRLALNPLLRSLFGGQQGGGFALPGMGGGQTTGAFGIPGIGQFNLGGFGGIGTGATGGFAGTGSSGWGWDNLTGAGTGSTPGLLGQGGIGGSSQSGGGGWLGKLFSGGKGFALSSAIMGAGLGTRLGGSSMLGRIVGGVGLGAVGLVAGSILPSIMAGTFAGLTAAGAATLGIGLALLPLAYFLGRDAARRRDEKTRTELRNTGVRGIEQLIDAVHGDRIEGGAALQQAEEIRKEYLKSAGELKDKKTRNIALKDVAALDRAIGHLKQAVAQQKQRQERLAMMVPTFADGGSLSGWGMRNLRNNPLGYQPGGESFGFFPQAGRIARFNERGSEYIFDAETTRNIGVADLDHIRATKGKAYRELKHSVAPPMFNGGSTSGFASSTGSGSLSSGPVTLELSLNVGLSEQSFVEVISATQRNANGSREQIVAIIKALKDDGQGQLAQNLASALGVKF